MWELIPLPLPLQAAFCGFCKLESFRDSQPFHPKNVPFFGFLNNKFMTEGARNLLIHEEILQFYRGGHADGLKAVACDPVPENHLRTDPFGVKIFYPRPVFWQTNPCPGLGQ